MTKLRVLVCGGRDFGDTGLLRRTLDGVNRDPGIAMVIHGAARGADTLAGVWAVANRVPEIRCPADWLRHGRSAGILRNQQMLDEHNPNLVIAFPGGRGTADMAARAEEQGIMVWRIEA
jgi:hypothetical protein